MCSTATTRSSSTDRVHGAGGGWDEPHGRRASAWPLFRKAAEGNIRTALLKQDLIEAVIGLAPNLFYGTQLAGCVVVLRRKKPAAAGRKSSSSTLQDSSG